jgi:hypothetical protein
MLCAPRTIAGWSPRSTSAYSDVVAAARTNVAPDITPWLLSPRMSVP